MKEEETLIDVLFHSFFVSEVYTNFTLEKIPYVYPKCTLSIIP